MGGLCRYLGFATPQPMVDDSSRTRILQNGIEYSLSSTRLFWSAVGYRGRNPGRDCCQLGTVYNQKVDVKYNGTNLIFSNCCKQGWARDSRWAQWLPLGTTPQRGQNLSCLEIFFF